MLFKTAITSRLRTVTLFKTCIISSICTIQYNTIRYDTTRYDTIQHDTIQCLEREPKEPVIVFQLTVLEIREINTCNMRNIEANMLQKQWDNNIVTFQFVK